MLTLLLLACSQPAGGGNKDDTGTDDTATDGPVTGPDDVVLDDSSDGIQVTIDGGAAAGWTFGVAWPAQGITDEACGGGGVCHPLAADGGFIPFCGGSPASDECTAIAQLYYRQDSMTYYLAPSVGLGCWVWGQETSYYDGLGCTVTDWEGNSY
jgi:hypothetical protein